MNGSDTPEALEADSGGARLAVIALLALGFAFLLGWGMVKIVDALEAEGGCGSYGYGGYACEPDRTDAPITVEPSTDLVDRQTVTVSGTKFDPHTFFGAVQCDADLIAEVADASACDLTTVAFGTTDADGNVALSMRVRRIINIGAGERDCAIADCVIGAATIPDGFNPLEGASAPISFDPDVPPVPRLTLEVTVDEVTSTHAPGTATCNREAELWIELGVEQERGGHVGFAYGYPDAPLSCDVEASKWTIPLYSDVRRLVGGPATYEGFASAFDGFDDASEELSGTTHVRGGQRRPPVEPIATPGETVSVEVAGWTGGDNHIDVELLVNCARPFEQGFATVQLSQWAGLSLISGFGYVEITGCDGEERISVEIEPSNGSFVGGPAEVRATVGMFDFTTGFFDQASAVDRLVLRGRTRPPDVDLPPNPSSRISISSVSTSTISGTVTCEEDAFVDLDGEVLREVGRRVERTFGFESFIPCDGPAPTSFTLELEGVAGAGKAQVVVNGHGYLVHLEGPRPYIEHLWNDYQADTVRIEH